MTPPETWVGVVAVLIITVGGLVSSWIQHRSQNRKLAEVQEQVVNNHGPKGENLNLRVQLDGISQSITEMKAHVFETRQDVAEIRGELRGLTHRVDILGQGQ